MTELQLQTAGAGNDEATYCTIHPERETGLRCNKCDRYMCAECAVQTPVGYRCKQCVRQHDDRFFNATQNDYVIIAGVTAGLSALAAAIIGAIGLPLFIVLLFGLPVGGGISEAVVRSTQRRRGRHSGQIAAASAVAGGLVGAALQVYLTVQNRISAAAAANGVEWTGGIPLDFVISGVLNDWAVLLFIAMIAFAVYSRFRMKI